MTHSKKKTLKVATRLFQEKGYAATTMRQIAKELEIEAPSIYSHFPSKDAILQEICITIANEFFKNFKENVDSNANPIQQLTAAIEGHLQVIDKHKNASHVFFHQWIFLSPTNLKAFKKMRYEYQQLFATIIENGMAAQYFKNMPTKLAVFTIFAALNATYDLYASKEKITTETIQENLTLILLNGIKK